MLHYTVLLLTSCLLFVLQSEPASFVRTGMDSLSLWHSTLYGGQIRYFVEWRRKESFLSGVWLLGGTVADEDTDYGGS